MKSKRYAIKEITMKDGHKEYGVYHRPWTLMWLVDPFVIESTYKALEDALQRVSDLDDWFDLITSKAAKRIY